MGAIEKQELMQEMIQQLDGGIFLYHERRTMLVKLLDYRSNDDGFEILAKRMHVLRKKRDFPKIPDQLQEISFSGNWDFEHLDIGNGYTSMRYGNWTAWFNNDLIRAVLQLVAKDDDLEALRFIQAFDEAN